MNEPDKVHVKVPASVGNMGPGFDVLGAAVTLYNELTVSWTLRSGFEVAIRGEGAGELPHGADNPVCAILQEELKAPLRRRGLRVEMVNAIPLGRGLGSSGAARLAAFLAAEALRGRGDFAGAAWKAALEEGHPDNVMASYKGGLTATVGPSPEHVYAWKLPASARVAVCSPEYQLSTEKARAVLPAKVPLRDAVYNLGSLAGLLGALRDGDVRAMGEYLEDRLHKPYRAGLIPGLDAVIAAARKAGAAGAALSGAGPTVAALCASGAEAEAAGAAMARAFKRHGAGSTTRILSFDNHGARVTPA